MGKGCKCIKCVLGSIFFSKFIFFISYESFLNSVISWGLIVLIYEFMENVLFILLYCRIFNIFLDGRF